MQSIGGSETIAGRQRYRYMDANHSHRPATVLIVEDEFVLRATLADFLQERGFNVVEAGTADDAVEIISHADSPVDVVFSDVMMPGKLDGFGLAQWLSSRRPDIPILLTSGNDRNVADAVKRCGRAAMSKPYDLDKVAGEIRKLV